MDIHRQADSRTDSDQRIASPTCDTCSHAPDRADTHTRLALIPRGKKAHHDDTRLRAHAYTRSLGVLIKVIRVGGKRKSCFETSNLFRQVITASILLQSATLGEEPTSGDISLIDRNAATSSSDEVEICPTPRSIKCNRNEAPIS